MGSKRSGVFFGGISAENAGKLAGWRLDDLDDLGRGRLYKAHDLGAQFVERRQRCKLLHSIDVEERVAHRPAHDFQLVVGLREIDHHLGGRDGIGEVLSAVGPTSMSLIDT